MKGRANLLLQLSIQVDQDVSAGDEVDARERRIPEEAVLGEQYDVPQFARDAKLIALACKEPSQAILGQIGFDSQGITAFPPDGQRSIVEIGSKNLDFGADLVSACFFENLDRDRIGLFASRAARNPDTKRVGGALLIEQTRNDERRKLFECTRVAEERRHRDEK